MKRLSILCPNYNYGHYLRDALDSILKTNQSEDFEIIVVDDASTDDSRTILKEYIQERRVRVFFLEENRGVTAAYNFALEQAKGQFIHLFASDDFHLPGSVDRMIHYIKQFPEAHFFATQDAYFQVTDAITFHPSLPTKEVVYLKPELIQKLFAHTDFWIPGHTIVVRKRLYPHQKETLGPAADWCIAHTLALKTGVYYLPITCNAARRHAHSYSHSQTAKKKREIWLHLLEDLKSNPHHYADLVRSGILRMLGIRAIIWRLLFYPRHWRFLFPMIKKEASTRLFRLLGSDRKAFWLRRLSL